MSHLIISVYTGVNIIKHYTRIFNVCKYERMSILLLYSRNLDLYDKITRIYVHMLAHARYALVHRHEYTIYVYVYAGMSASIIRIGACICLYIRMHIDNISVKFRLISKLFLFSFLFHLCNI